ncbi:MAG: DUF4153 domain-containing protein [Bacteroidales bacterium]|jgi:hypothetical protein|nr:DUF4153 domain-containing protein [Bacteroidales bacterium]
MTLLQIVFAPFYLCVFLFLGHYVFNLFVREKDVPLQPVLTKIINNDYMKSINFSIILERMGRAILRFPVATLCCVALFAVEVLYINDVYFNDYRDLFFKLNLLLPLGVVLSIAVHLFTEELGWRGWRSYTDVIVIPLLGLYYILLPNEKNVTDITAVCYAIFCLIATIGVVVAPFRSLSQPSLFWVYNVKILWRILFSIICSLIFLGGFCLALVIIEDLFEADISEKWYLFFVFFWCILFAPLFFVAGIPLQSQRTEEQKNNYPILRILGQYVLLPILLLYLLILYAYGLKIIIHWQLPKGWVSWLMIAYSGLGLFVYFLLHNFFITKATKISTYFGRYFFYSELPVILLLFVAVIRRTADYGITENRYFLWLCAFWLLGISLFMIFTKGKSFRPVFISFAVVALLSIVGPWSAFNVSDHSQRNHLKDVMTKNNLLQNGKCIDSASISTADYYEMRNILSYFGKKGNIRFLQPLFTSNIDSLYNLYGENDNIGVIEDLMSKLTMDEDETETVHNASFIVRTSEYDEKYISIADYSQLIVCIYGQGYTNDDSLTAEEIALACVVKGKDKGYLEIYHYGVLYKRVSLADVVKQLTAIDWDDMPPYQMATEELSVIIDPQYKIIFTKIEGSYDDNLSPNIEYAEMYILYKDIQGNIR